MSNFIQKSFDMLISSNPSLGAINVSNDGSSFSINLDSSGLGIPKDALNVAIQVIGAELWYNYNNIVSGVNSRFNFTYGPTAGSAVAYFVDLPDGLYSIQDIQTAIEREALKKYPADANISLMVLNHRIKISAEDSLGKVIITFGVDIGGGNTYGLSCDFTSQPPSIGALLGFNNVITATLVNDYFVSNVTPKFNAFNYYLIQSDIVSSGILLNRSYNGLLANILVQAKPQTQLIYTPINPAVIQANNLVNDSRRNYRFSLLTDSLTSVNTNGEYWSAQLRISYYESVNYNLI